MQIKKFKSFFETKSGNLYDYGCVMMYLDISNWEDISNSIEYSDLYLPNDKTHGSEKSPHVTLLYGLHSDVKDSDVVDAFSGISKKDIQIKIDGIGSFENKDFDVVKMNIESSILHEINNKLRKLSHTSDFPNYSPHITIAYVLPGSSKKYTNPSYNYLINTVNKIVYTKTNGEEIEIAVN